MELYASLVLVSLLELLCVSDSVKDRRSTDIVQVERRPVVGRAHIQVISVLTSTVDIFSTCVVDFTLVTVFSRKVSATITRELWVLGPGYNHVIDLTS